MKLLTYAKNDQECLGVLSTDGKKVYPLEELGFHFSNMENLVATITDKQLTELAEKVAAGECKGALKYDSVKRLAPIPYPSEHVIVCDENYTDNQCEVMRWRGEAFRGKREDSWFYHKRADPAAGDGDVISGRFDLSDTLDYGVELAVVLRKDVRDIPVDKVEDAVFGYTILNNLGMRHYLKERKQPYYGRSFDGFCPMGPVLVTKDEFDKFTPVTCLWTKINGERVQEGSTWLMSADIAQIVHTLSLSMTLKAGTIISTGTPGGTAVGHEPYRYLKEGDVIECGIEGIGVLTNTIGK